MSFKENKLMWCFFASIILLSYFFIVISNKGLFPYVLFLAVFLLPIFISNFIFKKYICFSIILNGLLLLLLFFENIKIPRNLHQFYYLFMGITMMYMFFLFVLNLKSCTSKLAGYKKTILSVITIFMSICGLVVFVLGLYFGLMGGF